MTRDPRGPRRLHAVRAGALAGRPALGLAAAAISLLLAGCATPPPAATPAGGLVQADQVLRAADAASPVQLLVQPDPVRIGAPIQLLVSSQQAGHLYVFQVDTDGRRVVPLFPNAVDGANHTRGGVVTLPRPGWQLTARGPAGQSYMVAVLSAEPMDLTAVARAASEGRIPTPARYGAAMATLREVAP